MWTWQGEGGYQMSILLHKPYFVKLSTKGEGIKNVQKTVHMVYGWPIAAWEKCIFGLKMASLNAGRFSTLSWSNLQSRMDSFLRLLGL